ncbi:LOW QUALITY PROTEIN: uncharacterized protein LOC121412125, partial [Lytechinus variegatus]|uniref:LOW QUALITY PROTEIN: uncharacterized protein LOC121412125 n=1 Tax=Lytechinus variegatus TaxID=7654 RepID=UPI001BB1CDA6
TKFGNEQQNKTKETGNMKKGSSHSGRTSPGLNVNKFKIPKKQKELLNEVELDSSEYLREVLPIIQQGYRDSSSKNKFNYEKVQLVHNPALKKEFIEKKREMKDAGRNEKELSESYAFLCVNADEKAKQLSEESLHAGTKRRKNMHCLGSPKMGVHVCRYSDVLHRNGVPNEGKLILFKILKGKVKAVPLVYGASEILEPTPNYDCHVAKNSGEDIPSSAIHRLFDSSELFIYDFDEDEVEFRKRPRNVCPFAVVHFTYSDTGIASTASSSSSFNRTPVASSNESTPTRNISVPDTVGIAVVAPCFPRDEIFTQKTISDADRPFIEKYNEYSERSYRVWSGQLLNKNGNSCRVSLVSFGLSFMPCKMPEALKALKAVRIRELRLPNKVFTGTVPVLSRVKEAQANGKYYWYAELHSLSLDDAVYSRFLNYLSEKELVLKKDLGDRVLLYILPTGRTTQNLGLTSTSHPKIMHCLVESCVPMVSHLTDITVKQPRHQVKPNLESAPIHDIDKDHLKRLRFQSSLAKLFYEQNKELKSIGVKGDKEECPVPVALPRQPSFEQSVEQSSVEPEDDDEVEKVSVMSPASPDEQVDENLNVFMPRTQQMDSLQSNQRTALHSKPSASPIDKRPSTDRQDWKNLTDRNRDQLGNKQSWDHSHPKPIHPKDQRRHSVETKEIHAKRDPPENHKQLQLGEVPNAHVGRQSPSHHLHSSRPSEHYQTGHQPHQQQPIQTEHQTVIPENQVGHPPHGHWSSKEWGPPKGPPRGMESSSKRPPQLPHHQQRHPSNPSSNQQYKRQSSSDWTSQQPNAKHRPSQDRRLPEAAKPDLPPQIKEVASKVHSMLTGGIDLALRGASGDTNVPKVRQETDDEKIARMRATLQALVEERERLAKNNSDKNSANPPTSVTPKGNQVLCSSSATLDTTSEPKAHSTESHKESTVEKPKECKVVEKSGESALPKGNGNDTDMKMKGRVDIDKENTTNSVESDGGKDSQKKAKQEKVKEKDSVKRKPEEIEEEPARKKIKVDDVPTAGAETKSSVPTQDVPVLPKDHPAVPKNNLQKNVEIGEGKTASKPIGGTDQQPKEPPSQEPISATTPLANPVKTVPATKPQKDQKKLQTRERKPKSTVEDKGKMSKKETSDIPSKVPKEITSASQMREYLERKHGTNKKGPEEPISSASEMKMFLENPDKVSTKMKRINSASEMCQFLNQPLIKNQNKGRSTADNARLCRELEGKSRDDLLKNHDGEFTNSHLQNFLSTGHQITWSLSQGLRVTVERDMAGALHLDPPPPGTPTEVMTEVDACNSGIMAVCHSSQRSMNGMEPDTSTKEGLAYQIRQVIHHSRPVKKLEPRKVKAVQKGEDGKRKNSTRNSTESRDSLRSESPAYIPDGKKKDNSKPTSKKQSQNLRPTFPVKNNSTNKAETPAGHAIGSKDFSLLQSPRKSLILKIKKIKKVYTAIPSSEEEIEKEKAMTPARQDLGSTKGLSQRKKDNASTGMGKPPGPHVSAKSRADGDKVVHQAKDVSAVNSIIGVPPAIDVTESVRDVVKCLSTDEIRQLIGVYDELFNRRPDVKEIQPVQMDSKDSPDAIQQSTVHPWAAGDTGQSGLQRADQDVGANKRMTTIAPEESVSEKSSDMKDHLSDLASPSHDEVKAKCPKDHVQELEKDHTLEWDIEEEDIITDIRQPGEHVLLGQDLPFLKKMKTGCPGDDVHPLTEDYHQEPLTSPVLDINENEKPDDDIKLAEDEDTQDTLPYPLDPVLKGANETDEGTASSTDGKVLMNEACIHLYDSDRWSELDEEIQTDASQGNASQEDSMQPSKAQPVNAGTDRLKKTVNPVVDAGDTALPLMSHTDVLSILIRECENKTPIRQKTDKEHLEGTKGLSVFERLSTYQSSARNVVKGEGEISDPSVMSSEASRYPEECGDKLKRNESPEPSSSLPVPADASQRTTFSIGDKGGKKEKCSKVSVFDRLTSKQVDEQLPKKKVSVFDRLFVPKPNKSEPAQSELGKSDRVSAFDRLSTRKVTKASPQKKQKGDSTSSFLSKGKKEKTTAKPTLPSKVIKVDSGKATTAVSSKVVAVKSKKTDEVIQKEKQNPEKDMLKANSKKREHPKEDIPASKKYKLATKDQGVKKDKYMEKSKENVTVKTDKSKESITVKKENKVLKKDLVKRPVSKNDPSRETFVVSNKSKQTSERLGKKEEKDLEFQRSRDTSNKKSNIVPQNQSRMDKNNKDKRSVKTSDQRSDKRPISRTKEESRIREERNRDSKDRDSDQSSVSTKEDSDSIRQNILRRAKGPTSDFSKYVVSGRYRKLDRKSPSRSETPTNSLTDNAGFEPDHDMTGERKVVDRYRGEGLSKCFSETHKVEIKNVDETQQYSLQPSYPIVDQIPKATDLSQVNEQQIHTISVIGGSTLNSMRPFCEANEDSDSMTTSLPDDLPLDRISVVGNRENDGYLRQVKVESYGSASPETPTILSPDTKREVEQVLKASIDSLTNEYRPESPTDSIRSVQSGHQDQFSEISNIPPTTSSYSDISCTLTQSTSAFTQSTYNRDEPSEDRDNSRKVKASLKAPSSRQVVHGNRFHPYDKRLKSFQGHCHSIREPETTELTDNFCKEEYRLRKLRAAARATSQDEFFDQARRSPSRFVSLHDMSHDEGVILKAEEVEVTHSRESAGDTSVGQKGDQLQILDRQIEALTAAGSDIQDFFILDANVYPIKNGDDSALSGVPARVRARRGRGRHPPRQQGPPHPYQIRMHQDDGYRGHPQDRWNGPADRFWNGPSQRSFDRPLDRPPDYPPPSRFHYRKGY